MILSLLLAPVGILGLKEIVLERRFGYIAAWALLPLAVYVLIQALVDAFNASFGDGESDFASSVLLVLALWLCYAALVVREMYARTAEGPPWARHAASWLLALAVLGALPFAGAAPGEIGGGNPTAIWVTAGLSWLGLVLLGLALPILARKGAPHARLALAVAGPPLLLCGLAEFSRGRPGGGTVVTLGGWLAAWVIIGLDPPAAIAVSVALYAVLAVWQFRRAQLVPVGRHQRTQGHRVSLDIE